MENKEATGDFGESRKNAHVGLIFFFFFFFGIIFFSFGRCAVGYGKAGEKSASESFTVLHLRYPDWTCYSTRSFPIIPGLYAGYFILRGSFRSSIKHMSEALVK